MTQLCYWWTGDERLGEIQNLGDALAPLLLKQFADIDVEWAPPDECDIICSGSILDVLPRSGWHGTVIGAGQLHENILTDLTFATVLGLRGELTRQRVQTAAPVPCIGDPGLLASELVTPRPNSIEVGVIPHWDDAELYPKELAKAEQYGYALPTLIDVTQDPLDVIAQIGSCRKVVASALHGIVTADAFHIPRRAEPYPSMFNDAVHEGTPGWKFLDYSSALGMPFVWHQMQHAPTQRIDTLQYQLFETFQTLKGQYA